MNQGRIEFEPHSHDKIQVIYAEGGIVDIFVEKQHYYLPARCLMVIPSNKTHSISGHGHEVQLFNFYFEPENEERDFFDHPDIYFASNLLREMILHTKQWSGIVAKSSGAHHFLNGLKSVLLELKHREIPYQIQHPYPNDELLKKITNYLLQNMDKNMSLGEIAKIFGTSERTLSRKFKEDLGMNYVRYLRSIRITRAMEMISENKYNMYEIAFLVGYNSLATFSNLFFKVLNMRPTDYQAMIQKRN